jgi:sulfatase modifying factor 1
MPAFGDKRRLEVEAQGVAMHVCNKVGGNCPSMPVRNTQPLDSQRHDNPRLPGETPRDLLASGIESLRILIPGGRAEVGTNNPLLPDDGEGPRRFVSIEPFALDAEAVSNARFAQFAQETGYITEAERFGWSFVFSRHLRGDAEAMPRVVEAEWWRRVGGASWKEPEGQDSDIAGRAGHPVVHTSFRDASAFAAWAGGRLPSEAEWEHAARGGRKGAQFPWGDEEPEDDGPFPCNIWQGCFPHGNTGADGYESTAPVRAFPPNGYGVYNMCGNVWEWCSDIFRVRSLRRAAKTINLISAREERHVLKGGSYLCHRSYCYRYRIAARVGNAPDTSTGHIGFRLAYDV